MSLVAVPLRMQARLLGWIVVASFTKNKKFAEGQRKLLSIVGSRAAAAIENARLYEDLRATFQQTIQGLAKAIDKMDRYTAGHSDRVATYAMYLAVKLGLPPDVIEIVRQSALMHDIGKIGCVMNLNKPGSSRRTSTRSSRSTPASAGTSSIRSGSSTRSSPACTCTTSAGTARLPARAEGEHVPLIARIIAVADTYDAMTSDRAYRAPCRTRWPSPKSSGARVRSSTRPSAMRSAAGSTSTARSSSPRATKSRTEAAAFARASSAICALVVPTRSDASRTAEWPSEPRAPATGSEQGRRG